MTIRVRKMRREDLQQVRAIDLVCFPTMMPPTNYKTELINPMAHYLVAWDDALAPVEDAEGNKSPFIVGFIGLWYMASEVHVINLAVHPDFRRRGIGELLLIHGIEFSIGLRAIMVTLEVRPSNTGAQALYAIYGFTERGVRKAYYLDNREDAVIMTLDDLHTPDYSRMFQRLKREFASKHAIHEKDIKLTD
jgi:[ribosomal protein S18]-alanine N-acetyltransferase